MQTEIEKVESWLEKRLNFNGFIIHNSKTASENCAAFKWLAEQRVKILINKNLRLRHPNKS